MIANHYESVWWMLPVLVLSWAVQIAVVVLVVLAIRRGLRRLRGPAR